MGASSLPATRCAQKPRARRARESRPTAGCPRPLRPQTPRDARGWGQAPRWWIRIAGRAGSRDAILREAYPDTMPPHVSATGRAFAGRARLLVIDDEAVLLACFARMLRSRHDVEVALSASLALSLLEASPAFDLVVCDLNLPDVTGRD